MPMYEKVKGSERDVSSDSSEEQEVVKGRKRKAAKAPTRKHNKKIRTGNYFPIVSKSEKSPAPPPAYPV